jgi:hypothetical protein
MLPTDASTLEILSGSAGWLADAVVQATSEPAEAAASSVESWRQYVPLVVISFVLVDIALGSPAAKGAFSSMQPPAPGELPPPKTSGTSTVDPLEEKKKQRIDTQAVAFQALDKAAAALELRRYLDSRKSDYDRMEDMKAVMDQQMNDLDRKNRPSE